MNIMIIFMIIICLSSHLVSWCHHDHVDKHYWNYYHQDHQKLTTSPNPSKLSPLLHHSTLAAGIACHRNHDHLVIIVIMMIIIIMIIIMTMAMLCVASLLLGSWCLYTESDFLYNVIILPCHDYFHSDAQIGAMMMMMVAMSIIVNMMIIDHPCTCCGILSVWEVLPVFVDLIVLFLLRKIQNTTK